MIYILVAWLLILFVGVPILYIGFGFVMAAKAAKDNGFSQPKIILFDTILAVCFVILDAIINVVVFSIICLDFRPSTTLTLVTGRFNIYAANPKEWAYRRWIGHLLAAFLDGKDPSGDHIKGDNIKFTWLD